MVTWNRLIGYVHRHISVLYLFCSRDFSICTNFDLFRKKKFKQLIYKESISFGSLMSLWVYIIGGLQSYRGIDKMGEINLLKVPRLIGRTYKLYWDEYYKEALV